MRKLDKDLRRAMARPWQPFKEASKEELESKNPPIGVDRFYMNNRYSVIVYNHIQFSIGGNLTGYCKRDLIQRLDDLPVRNWEDLQRVKREVFGDVWAVEFYPPEAKTINDHNIYWLHIFETDQIPIPFTSRS